MIASRTWQSRRVCLTKNAVHLAFEGEELEIDHIPLAEIVAVNEIREMDIVDSLELETGNEMDEANAYIISTEQGGHNSGREYYIRPQAKDCENLIKKLTLLSHEAKIRRENKNVIQRAQLRVLTIYESVPAQALVVFTMTLVGFPIAQTVTPNSTEGRVATCTTRLTSVAGLRRARAHRGCAQNFGLIVVNTQSIAAPTSGPVSRSLIARLNLILVVFFATELAINAFARWCAAVAPASLPNLRTVTF